ncbi:MAG: hypothetical protein ACHQVS_04470 [Candidatus Babeliales bacterium]
MARSVLYWPESVACVAHEMGHALAAKAVHDAPINVHLGAYWEEFSKDEQRTKGSKPGISIHPPFDFSKGFTTYKGRNTRIIDSAGPIAGIAISIGLLALMNKISQPNKAAQLLIESTKHVIRYEILHQTIYGLTPFYQPASGDGYRLWKSFNVSENTLKKIKAFDSKKTIHDTCFNLVRLKWLYEINKIIIK